MVEVCAPDGRFFVANAYDRTSTFAFVGTFIGEDLPTFGKPVRIGDLDTGPMLGSRAMCCRTCSRSAKDNFCCRMIDAIRPSAARLSCLHRYSESPYLMQGPWCPKLKLIGHFIFPVLQFWKTQMVVYQCERIPIKKWLIGLL